jgi:hypothetical protein
MLSTALITAPSFDETSGICAIVAVVDKRSVLRARGECRVMSLCTSDCIPWEYGERTNVIGLV